MTDLREKFVTETERTIDTKRRKMEELLSEAAELEEEIVQHRELLHQLKKPAPLPASAPPLALVRSADGGAAEEAEAETEIEAKARKSPIRLSNEDLLACAQSLGRREVTTAELAQVTGLSFSGARTAMKRLIELGWAKETKSTGALVPGVGVEPALYRVTQIKHAKSA